MRQTIDERLHLAFMHEADVAIAANAFKASAANIAADKRDAIRYSIIAGWNAAVAAMKDAASYAYSSGYTYCRVCRLAKVMGHQEWCFVGKLQAALALMDDNSPSRDEAMVEDKRYERDDIYKK